MRVAKLDVTRICIECFNEDQDHWPHNAKYVVRFTRVGRIERIMLCRKHLSMLYDKINKLLYPVGR